MGWMSKGFNSWQGQEIFLFLNTSRLGLGPTRPPIHWIPGVLVQGVKPLGHQAYNSPLSTANVKNEWNFSSAPILLHCIVPPTFLALMQHIMVWWLACLGALSQRIHIHNFVDLYRPSKLLHCPILSPSMSFLIPNLIAHFHQHFQLQEQPKSESNLHHNIISIYSNNTAKV